jgi:hypothetical protein
VMTEKEYTGTTRNLQSTGDEGVARRCNSWTLRNEEDGGEDKIEVRMARDDCRHSSLV